MHHFEEGGVWEGRAVSPVPAEEPSEGFAEAKPEPPPTGASLQVSQNLGRIQEPAAPEPALVTAGNIQKCALIQSLESL